MSSWGDNARRSSLQTHEGVLRPEAVKDSGQLRPIGPRAAGVLNEDPMAAGGGEFVGLEAGASVRGRNSG